MFLGRQKIRVIGLGPLNICLLLSDHITPLILHDSRCQDDGSAGGRKSSWSGPTWGLVSAVVLHEAIIDALGSPCQACKARRDHLACGVIGLVRLNQKVIIPTDQL